MFGLLRAQEVENKGAMENARMIELEKLTERLNVKKQALTTTADILGAMIESCPLPMWVKSKDGVMLYFNDSYAKIYGVKPEEYIGKADAEYWPDDVAHQFQQHDESVLKSKEAHYKVEMIPSTNRFRKDVHKDHITVVKWVVKLDGEVVGVAGVVTSVFPS